MRHQLAVAGGEVQISHEMHLRVPGMGSERSTQVRERRDYSLASQQLTAVRFSQTTGASRIEVVATRKDSSQMFVEVLAGGAPPHGVYLPVAERLADALASQRLVVGAKVQTQLKTQSFDASLQRLLHLTHTIEVVERRPIAGIPSQVVKVVSASEFR